MVSIVGHNLELNSILKVYGNKLWVDTKLTSYAHVVGYSVSIELKRVHLKDLQPSYSYFSQLDAYIWVVCGLVWLQETNTQKTCVWKRLNYVLKNSISILVSTINIIWREGIWPFNEHEIVKWNIHMSSKFYEKHGYVPRFGYANHLVLIMCFIS